MSKKIVILGAGESGVGAALLCKQQGYDVFVSDGGKIQPHFEKELLENQIEFEQGSHDYTRMLDASEVMKSPGIPHKTEIVKRLYSRAFRSSVRWNWHTVTKGIVKSSASRAATVKQPPHHLFIKSVKKAAWIVRWWGI